MTDPGDVTVSLVLTLAVMLSAPRPVLPEPPPPIIQPPPPPGKPFQDRWSDTVVTTARIIPLVRVVKTERIEPEIPLPQPMPEPPPVIDAVPDPVPQPPVRTRKHRAASLDICARHGMRRVNYGKRWRCGR